MKDKEIKPLKNEKNSSIELLRIFAMLGIITLHFNAPGSYGAMYYVNKESLNNLYMHFTESLSICGVDLFVMISGYFLVNRTNQKISKVILLITQVVAFRLIYFIVGLACGSPFSIKEMAICFLPVNYYVVLYSTLYIISPYINNAIRCLNKRSFKKMCLLAFFLFSVWTTFVDIMVHFGDFNSLSTIGIEGSQGGYTIVNFVLCYILGAYISIGSINISSTLRMLILLSSVFIVFFLSFFANLMWNYNNPFVICIAFMLLTIFKDIRINSHRINEFASGVFTCYLVQGAFLNVLDFQWIAGLDLPMLILYQTSVMLVIYCVSYIISKLYNHIVNRNMTYLFEKILKI